mmetsp:Transcript_12192/g.21159  ORF Transcript_12192/g.21159 Transcript_12192/m.21159 type:complete len:162 (+) Transcript_12192:81-566(+)|eukprot:CAMPEP_0196666430 /NCGR_PEP_ID=MMETSP1086-20130531/64508_1 /TAXON_ID=77921 /ORGANISM="Cyanoptyche  gloeocystis , Strain SAG4.97" /LENGTH=161 /DNA_ID=CAMNT_0042003619 /DNA_START=74 /DNA_END=559 /DNA_ORIENTATION=+
MSSFVDSQSQQVWTNLHNFSGIWRGIYTFLDGEGKLVDKHESYLEKCIGPGPKYFQRNTYTWPDGKQEVHEFGGLISDGKMIFDNDRLWGEYVAINPHHGSLIFKYKAYPEVLVTEMMHVSADKKRCNRTWMFLKDGKIYKMAVINEEKISDLPPELIPAA